MRGIDVSEHQGVIDWSKVQTKLVSIKMSGGDLGLYADAQASRNYYEAKKYGKAISMYHFAGGADATAEADFFIKMCSPLEKDDVLILDWEVAHPNPVEWCRIFCQRVIDKTGVKPMIYMNTNTTTLYDWTPVIKMDIALWVADYIRKPSENCPIGGGWKTYVGHQWTSKGTEPGINGNVDIDEWFATEEQFRKYGYQPTTTPPPVVTPPTPPVDPCADVKAENEKLKLSNSELAKAIKIKDDEIVRINSLLASGQKDTTQLNALGALLQWFIERLGLRKG